MTPGACQRHGAWLVALSLTVLACGSRKLPAPQVPLTATPRAALSADMPAVPEPALLTVPMIAQRTLSNGLTVVAIQTRTPEGVSVMYASRGLRSDTRCPQAALTLTVAALHRAEWLRDADPSRPGLSVVSHSLDGVLLTWRAKNDGLDAALKGVRSLLDRRAKDPLDYEVSRHALLVKHANVVQPHASLISWIMSIELKELRVDNPSIVRVSRPQVMACMQRILEPRQSVLVVSSPLKPKAGLLAVAKKFSHWPGTSSEARAPRHFDKSFPKYPTARVQATPWSTTRVTLALDAPTRGDPDFIAFTVLKRVLAGTASSLAHSLLRHERGLTYGVRAEYETLSGSAMHFLSTTIDANDINNAVRELQAATHQMFQWTFDPELLELGGRQVVSDINGILADDSSIARLGAALFVEGLPLEATLQSWIDQLTGLEYTTLRGAARRYFNSKRTAMYISGPVTELAANLQWLPILYTIVNNDDS